MFELYTDNEIRANKLLRTKQGRLTLLKENYDMMLNGLDTLLRFKYDTVADYQNCLEVYEKKMRALPSSSFLLESTGKRLIDDVTQFIKNKTKDLPIETCDESDLKWDSANKNYVFYWKENLQAPIDPMIVMQYMINYPNDVITKYNIPNTSKWKMFMKSTHFTNKVDTSVVCLGIGYTIKIHHSLNLPVVVIDWIAWIDKLTASNDKRLMSALKANKNNKMNVSSESFENLFSEEIMSIITEDNNDIDVDDIDTYNNLTCLERLRYHKSIKSNILQSLTESFNSFNPYKITSYNDSNKEAYFDEYGINSDEISGINRTRLSKYNRDNVIVFNELIDRLFHANNGMLPKIDEWEDFKNARHSIIIGESQEIIYKKMSLLFTDEVIASYYDEV